VPKASDLKRGMIVEIRGMPHVVKLVDCKSPSSRGAATLYKIRYTNLQTGQKQDESHKGDDFLKDADCMKVKVQYSYQDGDQYTFMNMEDFSQYSLNSDDLEGQTEYLLEGLEGITCLLLDGVPIAIELLSRSIWKLLKPLLASRVLPLPGAPNRQNSHPAWKYRCLNILLRVRLSESTRPMESSCPGHKLTRQLYEYHQAISDGTSC